MNLLLTLPILIPLLAAALSLMPWGRKGERWLGLAGTGGLFCSAAALLIAVRSGGIQVVQVGNWPAPYGITLVADLLSAVMVLLTGLVGLAVAVYSLTSFGGRQVAFGYFPLLHILLMGVCGAFLTGDVFNLYVWFEVLLIASFVLLALEAKRDQLEGALKYVTLNLLSSSLFLAAVGILYGATGTLNMADLAHKLGDMEGSPIVTMIAMLFLGAFGIKAAIFPLFFWLPASYHTPPPAISAVIAGLLTNVGVYSLIRFFTLLFVHDAAYIHNLILVIAGFTMVTGVLGAVAQNEFRRILSFHMVSQIGYMLMGLGLFTTSALAGTVFYILQYVIVNTNLFLVSGCVMRLQGTGDLKLVGGLWRSAPALGILFLIPALSLAGIPPLSGFFGKLMLVRYGFEAGQYTIAAVAVAVSLLTLVSMTKIWNAAFWKPQPEPKPASGAPSIGSEPRVRSAADTGMKTAVGASSLSVPAPRLTVSQLAPVVVLALLTIALGLLVEPVFQLTVEAAEQLHDPRMYIEAVMGDRG